MGLGLIFFSFATSLLSVEVAGLLKGTTMIHSMTIQAQI